MHSLFVEYLEKIKFEADYEEQEEDNKKLEDEMAAAAEHLKKLGNLENCETCDGLEEKIAAKSDIIQAVEQDQARNVVKLATMNGFMENVVNEEQNKFLKKYNNIVAAVKPATLDVSNLQNMANQAANNLGKQAPSGGNQFLMQQFTINNPIYAQPPPNRSYYRGSML